MRSVAYVVLLLLLAGGCGQKGPLYLRDNPPAGMKAPRAEPYTPLPYPQGPANERSADDASGAVKTK